MWLTDTSLGPWFYSKGFEDTKLDNSELIKMLIDVVSKNGCLLFNVPLKRDGSVPKNTRVLMEETGKWLDINGEAIYSTRPWVKFGEGPHVKWYEKKGKLKLVNAYIYNSEDIRFTKKGKDLFAISMGAPKGIYHIASVNKDAGLVTKVTMLGHDGELKFTQDANGLHISLPDTLPSIHANTFKIEGVIK